MSKNHLSDLENGKAEPRFLTILQIADALGVPPSKLFEPFDPKP